MGLLIILLVTEILTLVVLKQHFYNNSKPKYYLAIVIHIVISLWTWAIFYGMISYNSFYDNPRHVWLMMNMLAIIIAVIIPRIILDVLHFTGKLINIRKEGHLRGLTNTGLIIMTVVLSILLISATYERFNFTTEEVTIKIEGLNKDLDGLKIVQLSDMHLTSFYHHNKQLVEVMDKVNKIGPDLLINTGDFVSFGWREYDNYDTILIKGKSRYGNFAIIGNHDVGTYNPYFTEADKENNILNMNNLIKASGYQLLNDEFKKVKVGSASIAVIGVLTGGRLPHMTHGNLNKAISGIDSVDLKILLSHDPNHWSEEVKGKTNIDITLSGHTHGMQMGIITKNFRWSPAKYFYPNWNGLYTSGHQYEYVNRGLGVLSIPFRIWMPPEITVITIKMK
jgi:uncharacterized protein